MPGGSGFGLADIDPTAAAIARSRHEERTREQLASGEYVLSACCKTPIPKASAVAAAERGSCDHCVAD